VRNVEHADAVIASFLAYVRADDERIDQLADLGQVVNSAARRVQLPSAQVRAAADARVRGNATLLQQLVTNLLENAIVERHGRRVVIDNMPQGKARGAVSLPALAGDR
jgi:signal transduction histidine kinase